MRVLFALLAVLGLLFSPVAASAAGQACLHDPGGMSMSAATGAALGAVGLTGAHDCCDKGAGKRKPHDAMTCAQTCATICGVGAALPETVAGLSAALTHGRVEPGPRVAFRTYAPPGLERPPKASA